MIYTKASFIALAIQGLIILTIIVLVIKNRKEINKVEAINILIFIGILIGVYGLLHLELEKSYNYNPLELLIR